MSTNLWEEYSNKKENRKKKENREENQSNIKIREK